MARRNHLEGLIHCDACGEDYSATYKRCPFCGEPPQGSRPVRPTRESQDIPLQEDEDDDFVFEGQSAFDEEPEPPRPARAKGGKRLATNQPGGSRRASQGSRASSAGSARTPEPINWPRLITFLCGLVIIAAALVIVFTSIYPMLRQGRNPAASDTPANPSQSTSQDPVTLTGLALDPVNVSLLSGESSQLVLTLTPAQWTGDVVWTSSDESVATVSPTGLVTNVYTGADTLSVQITVTAGGLTAQCSVSCAGSGTATSAPPAQSDPPVVNTPAPGGDIPAGPATIINAGGGLRVRSGPGTSYDILASLFNGNDITVVRYAGDEWYEITFSGPGGEPTTGYIMGEYISAS